MTESYFEGMRNAMIVNTTRPQAATRKKQAAVVPQQLHSRKRGACSVVPRLPVTDRGHLRFRLRLENWDRSLCHRFF